LILTQGFNETVESSRYSQASYTTREKVFQIGPLEATKKTEKTIPLPPLLGGVALAGGIVLVMIGTRKKGTGSGK
jgi:hypothetical protein